MKNNRCYGITGNGKFCSRTGNWHLFCGDHNRQWIGWLVGLFTLVASAASVYAVVPMLVPRPQSVDVPGETNIERAIYMAKMEGVKFSEPSASEVVAKFYVSPTATYPLHSAGANFALVSVSPFQPADSENIFDAGDCNFLGEVTAFDPMSKKAVLVVKTISCTDNANQGYSLVHRDDGREPMALVRDLNTPTELRLGLREKDAGGYSVPLFSNAIIRFAEPVQLLERTGKATRF